MKTTRHWAPFGRDNEFNIWGDFNLLVAERESDEISYRMTKYYLEGPNNRRRDLTEEEYKKCCMSFVVQNSTFSE
jgi:hypothetical protein